MNVATLLTSQAGERADAPAIIEGGGDACRVISFAELDQRSARGAGLLAHQGISANDRVLLLVPMSIELYVALIAVFRIGATAVFLDPSAGLDHIARCCEIASPAALIASSKAHLLRFVSRALRRIPRAFTIGRSVPGAISWNDAVATAPPAGTIARDDDDPALLTFTSGSTGLPKAAVRSHGLLAAQHEALCRAIELGAGEIDLATLPIFSLANLASGVTTLIPDADLRRPGFIDARPVLRQIAQFHPSRAVASPALLERLMDAVANPAELSSFTKVYTGGAPVFPKLLDRLGTMMPAARITAVYGSTEAEPIAHIARNEITAADRAAMFAGGGLVAGRPVDEIDLRIIPNRWGEVISPITREAFDRMTVPAGEAGEIVVHGRHVLRGYLHGRGDEQSKFRVAEQIWHRTGDAGYLDSDRKLWLLGRAEARITDRRGTLYPFAVECAASRIEGVRRSALVHDRGKRLLVVELEHGATQAAATPIPSHLGWAMLDDVLTVPAIPLDKRHNAKVDYPALRKLLARRRGWRRWVFVR